MAQDAGKLDRIPTPPSFPINYNNILFKNLGTSVYNVFIFYDYYGSASVRLSVKCLQLTHERKARRQGEMYVSQMCTCRACEVLLVRS